MQYLKIKSKKFGEVTINLTEAIAGKVNLNENITKSDVEKTIKNNYNKSDFEDKIKEVVLKVIDSNHHESKVTEIVNNCLAQLFRQLWSKKSFWQS